MSDSRNIDPLDDYIADLHAQKQEEAKRKEDESKRSTKEESVRAETKEKIKTLAVMARAVFDEVALKINSAIDPASATSTTNNRPDSFVDILADILTAVVTPDMRRKNAPDGRLATVDKPPLFAINVTADPTYPLYIDSEDHDRPVLMLSWITFAPTAGNIAGSRAIVCVAHDYYSVGPSGSGYIYRGVSSHGGASLVRTDDRIDSSMSRSNLERAIKSAFLIQAGTKK